MERNLLHHLQQHVSRFSSVPHLHSRPLSRVILPGILRLLAEQALPLIKLFLTLKIGPPHGNQRNMDMAVLQGAITFLQVIGIPLDIPTLIPPRQGSTTRLCLPLTLTQQSTIPFTCQQIGITMHLLTYTMI